MLMSSAGCIIVKLWTVHKRTSSVFTRSSRIPKRLGFKDVILIIVESALLYTMTVALCIILDLARTNVYYGITDIVRTSRPPRAYRVSYARCPTRARRYRRALKLQASPST